jgi:hypothetical protein
MKIGPGAPPIKTTRGWLHIYHGVFPTMDGCVYRLGAALHCCGAVAENDGSVKLYWEGTAMIEDLVKHCPNNPRKAMSDS